MDSRVWTHGARSREERIAAEVVVDARSSRIPGSDAETENSPKWQNGASSVRRLNLAFPSTHKTSARSGGFRYKPTMSHTFSSKCGSGVILNFSTRCGWCRSAATRDAPWCAKGREGGPGYAHSSGSPQQAWSLTWTIFIPSTAQGCSSTETANHLKDSWVLD